MIYVGGTFEGSVDFNPLTFPTQVDMYTAWGHRISFLRNTTVPDFI